jgi:hypothetical protein
MSNANSIAGFSQSGSIRNQFPTQTILTATETQLTISTDTGTTPCFLYVPYGAVAAGAMAPIDTNANAEIIRRSNREYGLPSGEANAPYSSVSWDGHPFRVRISGVGNAAAQLATPTNAAFATATSGGHLNDTTTYWYRVAAINAQGGTSLASTQTSETTGNSGSNINTVTVNWGAVTGATGYVIYGRTTGAELKIGTVSGNSTTTFVDDGSVTPAGALPTSATSNVTLNLYQGTTTLASALATTGAVALAATAAGAFDFMIEATLLWDATSQVLSGWYKANLGYTTAVSGKNSSYTTDTVVTTVTTGVAISGLSFAASAIFGFASSANTITIRDFTIEKL